MRSIKSISLSCVVLLASFASPVFPAASSPEQVVKEYMAALQSEGMSAVSRFIHPEELKRFKEALMPLFRRDAAQKSEMIHGLFGAEATLASVEGMPPADLMNAFMRIAGEQLKDAAFGDVDIIGSVLEKDPETVHVVARAGVSMKEIKIKSVIVVSTRRSGDDWKLLLTAELEGMAAALKAL